MPLARLALLVVGLLTGVTFTVDSYVDSRRPVIEAPTLVDRPTLIEQEDPARGECPDSEWANMRQHAQRRTLGEA